MTDSTFREEAVRSRRLVALPFFGDDDGAGPVGDWYWSR